MRRALPKCFPFVPPVSEVQANLKVTLCKKSKGGAAGHFIWTVLGILKTSGDGSSFYSENIITYRITVKCLLITLIGGALDFKIQLLVKSP